MKTDLYFAIPGDINTMTGGYAYARRLITELSELGLLVKHLALSGTYPTPDNIALGYADKHFAAFPDGAIVLADGLAFGVLDAIAQLHSDRLKIIALCHHPLALETGLSNAHAQELHHSEQRALAAAVAVLVNSSNTAGILTKQFAVKPEKIVVALPGTDSQVFAECNGNPPVLLTVATLTHRKAHDVLITALAQITDLPWVARFVGSKESDPNWTIHLISKTVEHRLENRINFMGTVAELSAEYSKADLFVLPSLFEGYGMVFAEALAYGLPIVAARSGAVPDVVPDTAGILVTPNNADELATALRLLLTQPALRGKLQRGARRAASHLPTWKNTAMIVANLVSEVKKR
ncbi:MAG: glycosyltransferase family 4 protein [Pseudohongiellaceae bacterium]